MKIGNNCHHRILFYFPVPKIGNQNEKMKQNAVGWNNWKKSRIFFHLCQFLLQKTRLKKLFLRVIGRGQHETGTLSRRIFGPGDSRPGFFRPQDYPGFFRLQDYPGFFCPAGHVSGVISDFESRVPSRVPDFSNSMPRSRNSPKLANHRFPVPIGLKVRRQKD